MGDNPAVPWRQIPLDYPAFRLSIATLGPNSTGYTDAPPYGGPYTYAVESFNGAGPSSRPTVQESGCIY